MRKLLVVLGLVGAVACSGTAAAPVLADDAGTTGSDAGVTDAGGGDAGSVDAGPQAGPVTTANPPGEQHIGAIAVTLTSNRPATITYTTDGSDPTTSATATSAPSPVAVALSAPAQVTLRFFGKDANGATEAPHSETYTLLEQTIPASITGTVYVQELLQAPQAQVLVEALTQDPTITPNAKPAAIQTLSAASPAGLNYKFEGLAAGRYWIAAAWWPGNISGDPQAYALAAQNPIDLDPSVVSKQRADFVNLFIGMCDPKGTGVDGVVDVGTHLLADVVGIAAFTQDLTLANLKAGMPKPTFTFAVGSGPQRPFALCNLPPGTVNILAAAGNQTFHDPTDYVAAPTNPISVTQLSHLHLFLESPTMMYGSVSGHINLSGPLLNGRVTVVLTTEPWSENAPISAIATIFTNSATSYDYTITGLPAGSYYLTALAVDDAGTTSVSAVSTPIMMQASGAAIQDLSANVGRAVGSIDATNVPLGSSAVQVVVLDATTKQGVAAGTATLGTPDGSGVRHAQYDVFGIPDGSYVMAAVFLLPGDQNYGQAANAGHIAPAPGTALPSITIMIGSTVTQDFSRTF